MKRLNSLSKLSSLKRRPNRKRNLKRLSAAAQLSLTFSALTDLWTTVAATGTLLPAAYLTFLASGLPFTVLYAVSNVLFLLVLTRPILRKTDRLKQKYGLFD